MNKKIIKNIGIFLASFIVYFLATYPARNLFTVFTVTDVRPGAALNPLISMCFGPWAILGIAASTTLADYFSGYPTLVLFQGFFFQYLYGYLSYLTWKYITKNEESRYRLDNFNKVLKFTTVALVFAISSGMGVGYIVYSNFGANGFKTMIFVFLNNFNFTMMLGMPILITLNVLVHYFASGELRKISRNEKLIILNVILDVVALMVIVKMSYNHFAPIGADVYTIWNNVFIYGAIVIDIILVIFETIMYRLDK